jgi:hypothetical protein
LYFPNLFTIQLTFLLYFISVNYSACLSSILSISYH